ncbi:MAG: serine/threonine protein kinase [Myxococcales bacterium]|nr:serine/threonine protein kinase [Myxococcales bacterium]
MGVRDWFKRVFSGGKTEANDEPAEAAPTAPSTTSVKAPTASAVADASRRSRDATAQLVNMPIAAAIAQAIATLDATQDAAEAAALNEFLRRSADDPRLTADLRIRLSDWLSSRDEPALATKVLVPLVTSGNTAALPALVRLADLAAQRGDAPEQVRLYDEILAIDVGFPGVRERLARLRAPAKAGEAGATLIAPEATRLGAGRFELMSELGRGGAGAVFIARDSKTRRVVALKLYHPGARGDRNARLKTEAQVACANSSRYVVRVFDLIEDLGAITMEHCAAPTLRRMIARGEGGVGQRRAWARGVAHALAVTHNNGWVHRDLKPGNILQRADGSAVLTDFGLAARIGSRVEPAEGTAGYTPPEARTTRVADPRADVFAFGAFARELAADRDPALAALAAQCTAEDPAKRPRDGAALLAALEATGGL